MQSIRFLKEGMTPYLLVSLEREIAGGFGNQLLQYQKIPYFLQYEVREFNGNKVLYYRLKYHTNLGTIIEHLPFTTAQLKNMLHSIIGAIQTADEYLLRFEGIVWKTNQIFMELDSGNLEFCYNPVKDMGNGSIQELLSEILSVVNKKNEEGFLQLLQFYNLITNPDCTLECLLEYRQNYLEPKAGYSKKPSGNNSELLSKKEGLAVREYSPKYQTGIQESFLEPENAGGNRENKAVRIVRGILITVAVIDSALIIGLLCNVLTYDYIQYLLLGMVVLIVFTIIYMNIDKEDNVDQIMQEYLANSPENEKKEEIRVKDNIVMEYIANESNMTYDKNTYIETTVLTAENDDRSFCLMPVIKDQFSPIYIKNESVVVGSWEEACDYVIQKNGVSRMHFKLIQKEGEMYMIDLNSTNGTYLNGTKLESGMEYKIEEGDIIAFARLEFFVLLE